MSEPHLLRDPFVALVRLRYVLSALSAIHHGPAHLFLRGDARVGQFSQHDGCGDLVVMAWDEAGIVALGFDHEDTDSERHLPLDARAPERWLSSAPPELAAIVEVVSELDPRLATTGFWATAQRSSSSFLENPLGDYQAPAASALVTWGEQLSIDPPQVELGVVLAARSLGARTTLTDEEAQIACKPPGASNSAPRPDAVRNAAKLLAAAGIDWDPEPLVATLAAARQGARSRAKAPPTPREAANARLLQGAYVGSLQEVTEALADGADIDTTSATDEVERTPARATALVIALRMGHRAVAEQLLAAGAAVDPMTEGSWGGPEYALRHAAALGDPGMVAMLLQRGASVRPEEAFWGVVRHVYERVHERGVKVGTDADYAQVLRLLLDHGAPLPNPHSCDVLANFADAAGAPDVAERLATKPTTEVVLPEVAPIPLLAEKIDAELPGLLEDALAWLGKGNRLRAIQAIEEAFRLARHPRLADLLDASPEPPSFAPLHNAIETLVSMQVSDDPRASRGALRALVAPEVMTRPVAMMEASEDRAAAMLVASRDVRFTEALADRVVRGRPCVTRARPRESLDVALGALQAFVPHELSPANRDRVSQLDDALRGRKPIPGARAIRDLYMAVYDDPRNGALRDELATRLEASGDPHGELIRLQRARRADEKPSKRERELLKAHATKWLGEIAPVIADDEVFRDGFVWRATTGERGASLAGDGGWPPILATGWGLQPEWATVERLSAWRHLCKTLSLFEGRRLHGLRELTDVGLEVLQVIAKGPTRPLEILELGMPRNPDIWASAYDTVLADALAKLPDLREARIPAARLKLARLEEILARACGEGKPLRQLSVGLRTGIPRAGGFRALVDMAHRLRLASITMLSAFDLRYDLATQTAEVEFTGGLRDTMVSAVAAELPVLADSAAGAPGLKRLVVRHPPRAKIVGEQRRGVAPVLSLKGKSTDLAELWTLAKELGAECTLEVAVPHWSGSPKRDQ